MPRPSASRGRMEFRSSCSPFTTGAHWPRSWKGRGAAQSSPIRVRLPPGTEDQHMTSTFDKEDLNRRMNGSVAALKHEFAGLRTGRANTALLDPVTVEAYGNSMPINQLGTVSAPEPRLLTVQVW